MRRRALEREWDGAGTTEMLDFQPRVSNAVVSSPHSFPFKAPSPHALPLSCPLDMQHSIERFETESAALLSAEREFRERKRLRSGLDGRAKPSVISDPPHESVDRGAHPSQLVTGGASGADETWLRIAISHSVDARVFSFDRHRIHILPALARIPGPSVQVVMLTRRELEDASVQVRLRDAARRLRKRVPALGSYTYNLLARSVLVVNSADALYAVGRRDASALSGATAVQGGTGWTCELFAARAASAVAEDGVLPSMYLFDMDAEAWFAWDRTARRWGSPIERPPPPTTFHSWAGVGSRDLSARGTEAIASVFAKAQE